MNSDEMEWLWKWSEWQWSDPVALHWLIGSPVARFIKECYPLALDWSEWHSSGKLTLDWLMSGFRNSSQGLANRPLPFIKGSDRLATTWDEAVLLGHWHSSGEVALDWMTSDSTNDKNLPSNRGFSLVESQKSCLLIGREVLWKFSKGVPLRSWISVTGVLWLTKWHWIG